MNKLTYATTLIAVLGAKVKLKNISYWFYYYYHIKYYYWYYCIYYGAEHKTDKLKKSD